MISAPPPAAAPSDRKIAERIALLYVAPILVRITTAHSRLNPKIKECVDEIERALAAKDIATEWETVEKCAEIAETHLRCWGNTETETHGEDIAAAIRAISPPDPAPTKEPS